MNVSKLDYVTNKRVQDTLFCHLGDNMTCLFCRYDLVSREWLALNRSVNDVVVRYGHSIALHQVKCLRPALSWKLSSSMVTLSYHVLEKLMFLFPNLFGCGQIHITCNLPS